MWVASVIVERWGNRFSQKSNMWSPQWLELSTVFMTLLGHLAVAQSCLLFFNLELLWAEGFAASTCFCIRNPQVVVVGYESGLGASPLSSYLLLPYSELPSLFMIEIMFNQVIQLVLHGLQCSWSPRIVGSSFESWGVHYPGTCVTHLRPAC